MMCLLASSPIETVVSSLTFGSLFKPPWELDWILAPLITLKRMVNLKGPSKRLRICFGLVSSTLVAIEIHITID